MSSLKEPQRSQTQQTHEGSFWPQRLNSSVWFDESSGMCFRVELLIVVSVCGCAPGGRVEIFFSFKALRNHTHADRYTTGLDVHVETQTWHIL